MRLLTTFFVVLMCTTIANAEIMRVGKGQSRAIQADRFEVIDIPFNAKERSDKPFEVEFTANFVSPSGKKQSVPAFYNGGDEWVVRFSAGESGEWSYVTSSEFRSLDGKKGKLNISQSSYADRKGMVVRSEDNPRHFFWEDGSPYFLLAFECDFLFALDYHCEEETPKLDHFVNTVADQGFNHFVMNLYAHDVVWEKDPKLLSAPHYEFGGDQTIFPFMGSNDNPDHSALNVEFFKHFDRTMEALNDRNIISHLMIYVWNKAVSWAEYGSEEDNRYFDYVIKRYQAFSNVLWDISKEAIYYGNVGDDYILSRIERVRELDSFKRLVTVHDYGFCSRNRDDVDFISRQDWTLPVNEMMLNNYDRFTDKPSFNIENGGYEESDYFVFCGNYVNAEYLLRRSYETLFAGVYTTYYWQGCSWNVLIYDFDSLPEGCYRPKMEYYKHMGEFFNRFPFCDFTPEPKLSKSGFCMSNSSKDTYIYYMPKESYKPSVGQVTKGAKRISYQWFNTHTGEYTEEITPASTGMFDTPAHPWHTINDAILVLRILEEK